MRIVIFFALYLLMVSLGIAQPQKSLNSAEIYHRIKKLNFLGSALFLAAHPDDENTRLIAYLANKAHARTAYLSLTRGDGGQNLIGSELRELLGVLRTQELLAARSVDGGTQYFTRANDFGYSKTAEETLEIWDKKDVLHDMVWVIRNFKPDVIINRFDHRAGRRTHGHHTASAILSLEAFDMVGNKNVFPEQLEKTVVWQPKRLFFNTSWWMYGSREKFEKADKSNFVQVDVGTYYPELGVSNNEIAAKASSQHLCQGFGRLSVRGSQPEYLELIKGDLPKNSSDLFAGIDTSWNRVEGGQAIAALLEPIEQKFNFQNPAQHLPVLLKAYEKIAALKDKHWKSVKLKEIKEVITACSGLFLEATTNTPYQTAGETVKVSVEALNRSKLDVTIKALSFVGNQMEYPKTIQVENLKFNKKEIIEVELALPANSEDTNAYWLNRQATLGMYAVQHKALIGMPESPRALQVKLTLEIEGITVNLIRDVVYRYSKPDKGERYEPFDILPEATVSLEDQVVIFAENNNAREIKATVTAHKNNIAGKLSIIVPEGWKVHPKQIVVNLEKKGDSRKLSFQVTPPKEASEITVQAQFVSPKGMFTNRLYQIAYDHIPTQRIQLPATAKWVHLPIKKVGENIGYIMGAGDAVPESLEQIGYRVIRLKPDEINLEQLKKFDAIVMGIRAYNVVETLKFKQKILLDYVHQGGTMLVQYNTANRWARQFENIAPYSLTLSRDRVTDEHAEVEILVPDHPVMQYPNKISQADFNGWVQERGLYFPNKWDTRFTPILGMKDKGETQKKGSLLVANYGKGTYVYTGLSFFRELPAGVSGAYKLFANILSLGQDDIQQPIKQ